MLGPIGKSQADVLMHATYALYVHSCEGTSSPCKTNLNIVRDCSDLNINKNFSGSPCIFIYVLEQVSSLEKNVYPVTESVV